MQYSGLWFLIFPFFGRFVQASLIDNGVNGDRRLPGRAIPNDQFPLPASDRDHRVNRQNTGLDRHRDALSLDNAGSNLFDRISLLGFDRTFAVDRLAQSVDHPA